MSQLSGSHKFRWYFRSCSSARLNLAIENKLTKIPIASKTDRVQNLPKNLPKIQEASTSSLYPYECPLNWVFAAGCCTSPQCYDVKINNPWDRSWTSKDLTFSLYPLFHIPSCFSFPYLLVQKYEIQMAGYTIKIYMV